MWRMWKKRKGQVQFRKGGKDVPSPPVATLASPDSSREHKEEASSSAPCTAADPIGAAQQAAGPAPQMIQGRRPEGDVPHPHQLRAEFQGQQCFYTITPEEEMYAGLWRILENLVSKKVVIFTNIPTDLTDQLSKGPVKRGKEVPGPKKKKKGPPAPSPHRFLTLTEDMEEILRLKIIQDFYGDDANDVLVLVSAGSLAAEVRCTESHKDIISIINYDLHLSLEDVSNYLHRVDHQHTTSIFNMLREGNHTTKESLRVIYGKRQRCLLPI